MISPRDVQTAQEGFATVAKALASPHRLSLLTILAQGARPVEELVEETRLSFANVSQHLQVLRRAGLVASRREGQRVMYSLAGDDVVTLYGALQRTAERHQAEVERAIRSMLKGREELDAISMDELFRRIEAGDVTVLDVRPRRDFDAGHIPGALNIPSEEFERRLGEIPADREVVAYCRGPYCVCADDAVRVLARRGVTAARLDGGLPEWRAEGLPVALR